MNFFEQMKRFERIDQLVRLKATGKPKALATRLNISERRMYDLINAMKEMGAPINYCHQRQSYYYKEDGRFHCNIQFEIGLRKGVLGGFSEFFSRLQNNCSAKSDLAVTAVGGNRKP